MATGGYRTLKKRLGSAGAFINPSKGATEGLRALLKEVLRDLANLQTHTHKASGATTITSKPGSDAEGGAATTPITFGAFTIE